MCRHLNPEITSNIGHINFGFRFSGLEDQDLTIYTKKIENCSELTGIITKIPQALAALGAGWHGNEAIGRPTSRVPGMLPKISGPDHNGTTEIRIYTALKSGYFKQRWRG